MEGLRCPGGGRGGQYRGHRFHGGDDLGMSRRAGNGEPVAVQCAAPWRFGDGIQERTTGDGAV
jgi:hypothetical protein